MLVSGTMQVESALLFETPEQIFARVFHDLKPRTPLPEIGVEFCRFANPDSYARSDGRPPGHPDERSARRRAGAGARGAGVHSARQAVSESPFPPPTPTATAST